ncbi:hypothetical protein ACLBXB_25660 [Methylobacterium mesophilicum]
MDSLTLDLVPPGNPPPAAAGFDYDQLDDAAANQAKAVVERYRERQKAYVIDTGRDLLAVKERLEHGLFLEWVQAEMQMTPRSAQRAMGAAEVLGAKSDTVSYLPPSILYALSAPSTPAPVRDGIVERIEAGEMLPPRKVEWMLHEARARARQEQADAKLAPEERRRRAKSKRETEARRKREHEKWRQEQDERRDREKARAVELAGILAPLLDDETYSRVYRLIHEVHLSDMRAALIDARTAGGGRETAAHGAANLQDD